MRARKYECLTAYIRTRRWKFTTPRDGTVRFCRECKFVSCYLHEVERRSYNRFPQARHERERLVYLFKMFQICSTDGAAVVPANQMKAFIRLITVLEKYIF